MNIMITSVFYKSTCNRHEKHERDLWKIVNRTNAEATRKCPRMDTTFYGSEMKTLTTDRPD
jgi:hypothetical protein